MVKCSLLVHFTLLVINKIQEPRHVPATLVIKNVLPASKRSLIGFLISNPFFTCRTASANLKEI